ncbi:hypothetical protein MPSEU_000988900 [Mayamaea pseudoterrestris]|nr:hypothetical protein MPSEU_000988900 [Mayamaea pseudoterrestris]
MSSSKLLLSRKRRRLSQEDAVAAGASPGSLMAMFDSDKQQEQQATRPASATRIKQETTSSHSADDSCQMNAIYSQGSQCRNRPNAAAAASPLTSKRRLTTTMPIKQEGEASPTSYLPRKQQQQQRQVISSLSVLEVLESSDNDDASSQKSKVQRARHSNSSPRKPRQQITGSDDKQYMQSAIRSASPLSSRKQQLQQPFASVLETMAVPQRPPQPLQWDSLTGGNAAGASTQTTVDMTSPPSKQTITTKRHSSCKSGVVDSLAQLETLQVHERRKQTITTKRHSGSKPGVVDSLAQLETRGNAAGASTRTKVDDLVDEHGKASRDSNDDFLACLFSTLSDDNDSDIDETTPVKSNRAKSFHDARHMVSSSPTTKQIASATKSSSILEQATTTPFPMQVKCMKQPNKQRLHSHLPSRRKFMQQSTLPSSMPRVKKERNEHDSTPPAKLTKHGQPKVATAKAIKRQATKLESSEDESYSLSEAPASEDDSDNDFYHSAVTKWNQHAPQERNSESDVQNQEVASTLKRPEPSSQSKKSVKNAASLTSIFSSVLEQSAKPPTSSTKRKRLTKYTEPISSPNGHSSLKQGNGAGNSIVKPNSFKKKPTQDPLAPTNSSSSSSASSTSSSKGFDMDDNNNQTEDESRMLDSNKSFDGSHASGSTATDDKKDWMSDATSGWDAHRDLFAQSEEKFFDNNTGYEPMSSSVIRYALATMKKEASRIVRYGPGHEQDTMTQQPTPLQQVQWRKHFDAIIASVHQRIREEGLPNVYIRAETSFDATELLPTKTAKLLEQARENDKMAGTLKPKHREWEHKDLEASLARAELSQELDHLLKQGQSLRHPRLDVFLNETQNESIANAAKPMTLYKSAPAGSMKLFVDGFAAHCESQLQNDSVG